MVDVVRWYPSKVDTGVAIALMVAPLVTVLSGISVLVAGGPIGVALMGPAAIAAVYALVVLPIRYGIGAGVLVVRFGLVRRRITLDQVRQVEPTSSLLSAPALSRDRLRIVFGDRLCDTVVISPGNRDAFLSDLVARCRLVRTEGGWRRE